MESGRALSSFLSKPVGSDKAQIMLLDRRGGNAAAHQAHGRHRRLLVVARRQAGGAHHDGVRRRAPHQTHRHRCHAFQAGRRRLYQLRAANSTCTCSMSRRSARAADRRSRVQRRHAHLVSRRPANRLHAHARKGHGSGRPGRHRYDRRACRSCAAHGDASLCTQLAEARLEPRREVDCLFTGTSSRNITRTCRTGSSWCRPPAVRHAR